MKTTTGNAGQISLACKGQVKIYFEWPKAQLNIDYRARLADRNNIYHHPLASSTVKYREYGNAQNMGSYD